MIRPALCLPLLCALAAAPLAAQTAPKAKSKARPAKAAKTAPAATPVQAPAPTPEPTPAPQPKPRVRLETSYGPIVVELEPDITPLTVANFLSYVRQGHYAGTIFHRVIDGFMIQGGGHLEDLTEKPLGTPILNETAKAAKAGLKNTRGTIAMARLTDPNSATAQFYINTADNPPLDHKAMTPEGMGYCPFGRVVEGMDVVDKIGKVRTVWRKGYQDVPDYPVRLKAAVEVK